MLRKLCLSAALMLGASSFGQAAMPPLPLPGGDSNIVRVEDGCGPGFMRNEWGHCRPKFFLREREHEREEACPRFWHWSHEHHRCRPD